MDIVVLAGGLSSERDVSLKSGQQIAASLKNSGHRVILVDVFMGIGEKEIPGCDFFRDTEKYDIKVSDISAVTPDIRAIKASRADKSASFFGPNVIAVCRMADIVFMALHGSDGENGKVQAAFDLHGIKYTGNGYLPCALAMDKGITKQFVSRYDVPTPQGFSVNRQSVNGVKNKVALPVVVKPACGGSSIGVSIVRTEDEIDDALAKGFAWEDELIIEDYIEGREFSVGVMRGSALPVIEIAPKVGFYNYENKYKAGSAVETCPAEIGDDSTAKMQLYAERVCAALGINTYARMDFIMKENGDIYFLEANTLPGMTPTSLLPQEAAVVGIDFDELCEEIIKISMEKYL